MADEVHLSLKPLFFKRVMKSIKDHRCYSCGRTILTKSSYFYSLERDPETGYFMKVCANCFDERLGIPTAALTKKALDKLTPSLLM